MSFLIFFFNDTATTEIYTLSLHDALPIWYREESEKRSCSFPGVSWAAFISDGLLIAGVRAYVLFNNAAMAYFNWLEDISNEEWDRNRREEVDLVFSHSRCVAFFEG